MFDAEGSQVIYNIVYNLYKKIILLPATISAVKQA